MAQGGDVSKIETNAYMVKDDITARCKPQQHAGGPKLSKHCKKVHIKLEINKPPSECETFTKPPVLNPRYINKLDNIHLPETCQY